MSVDLSKASIAQWFADREQHRCGYCKHPSGSISYGMLLEELNVEDYKDLIDRGWRRSGKYCYKPTMDKTCCPQYTIRCDVTEFTLNKSHKKIIKKFNKFLNDGIFSKNVPPDQHDNETTIEIPGYSRHSSINLTKPITTAEGSSCHLREEISQVRQVSEESSISLLNDSSKNIEISDVVISTPNVFKSKKTLKDGAGADPSKPPCKKAKLLRLERKKDKMSKIGNEFLPTSKTCNAQKTLSQFLEVPSTAKHKLKLRLIPTSKCGDEWDQVKDAELELYAKYQTIVHNDTPEHLNMRSFTSFLVTSPLKPKSFPNGVAGPGYGSFHQQYWIDEKLIAVGVIDILPGCVSSVYFFYDPDYRDLTLGTYGSLREIQLVQNLRMQVPDLKYYYMGFYIHSCPKMRYKGKLNPSYLACPETYEWIPIEKCLEKLNANKYSRLNEDVEAIDSNDCNQNDINSIKIVYNYKLMHVKDFVTMFKADRNMFKNLAHLIGKRSTHSIVFWID